MQSPNDPLAELEQKITAAKERQGLLPKTHKRPAEGMGMVMHIGTEMVAGVAVGLLIGYWIDRWLGTMPLFFILCFFLGVAGSALNIYRLVRRDDMQRLPEEGSDVDDA